MRSCFGANHRNLPVSVEGECTTLKSHVQYRTCTCEQRTCADIRAARSLLKLLMLPIRMVAKVCSLLFQSDSFEMLSKSTKLAWLIDEREMLPEASVYANILALHWTPTPQ